MRSNEVFAQYVDSVLANSFTTKPELDSFLNACIKYKFKGAACLPCWYEYAAGVLAGSGVELVGAAGYPEGYDNTAVKVFQAYDSFEKGATELDMIINIGWMLEGRYADVEDDIRQVVKACGDHVSKVIIETCYLSDEQKREAVRICKRAGATFVKTSTGLGPSSATLEDVKLMVKEAGDSILIKASGGIRTREFAEQLLDAGAMRLGISNPQNLLN